MTSKVTLEPIAIALHEMRAKPVLVRREHVESAVEPVVVDLRKWDAREVFERRPFIPVLGDGQLRALRA